MIPVYLELEISSKEYRTRADFLIRAFSAAGIEVVRSLARFESLTAFIQSPSCICLHNGSSVQQNGDSDRLEMSRCRERIGCSHSAHDAIRSVENEYS